MNASSQNNSSAVWGWALAAGIVAFLVLKFLVRYGLGPALLLAVLIGVLVAILLWVGFYRDAEAPAAEDGSAAPPTATAAGASDTAAAASAVASPKTAPEGQAEKPAAGKAGEKSAPPKAAAKKPASKTSARSAAGMMGDAGTAMVSEKKSQGAKRAPVAKDGKPETLGAPRGGKADDLKKIKGVGPGLEKTLNELGFYHYDQIASWRKKEIEWVDARLRFKGRIERDDWVKQAKALARGAGSQGD